MIFNKLTTNEKHLIKKCSVLMIDSFTRLATEGHQIFDDLLDSYEEVRPVDIDEHMVDSIILWEGIRDNPTEYLPKLKPFDILIMRMLLLEALQPNVIPKSTKMLADKLDYLLNLNNINSN